MDIKNKLQWDAKRLLPPVVLGVTAIGYMVIASGFEDNTSSEAPMLYGTVLLALSVLVFLLALAPGLKAAPKRSRTKHQGGPFAWRVSFEIFGLIAAFIALVFCAGFYVAIPVFLFLFLKYISQLSAVKSLICAAVAYGFVWAIFSYFLHLEVFTGYIARHL
jgi:Kef-type K+ transport system membrane component KefB